jgi:hypothetical protein
MSKLKPRIKHIPLDFLGPEWAEAYLDFTAITFPDLERLDLTDASGKAVRAFLREKFVAGQGIDAHDAPFALTAEDLDQLDIETVKVCIDRLAGQPDPNA